MKKALLYSFFIFAAFSISSCVQPFDEEQTVRIKGDYNLDLSVTCTAPLSKAKVDDKPGENKYNENVVNGVNWFIFVPGDTPLLCARGYSAVTQTDGSEVFKIQGPIAMDKLVQDYGNNFFVYTIANLPSTLQTTLDATDDEDISFDGLQNLALTADFNKNPFTKQDSFVMQGSYDVTFTASDNGKLKKVTVDLKRVAAKITINMNVIPAFDQMKTLPTGEQEYQKTWYPDISTIQVYLSFANKDIPLKGDPIEYSQEHFFTYYRAAFQKSYSYTGNTSTPSETLPSGQGIPNYTNPDWRWIVTGSPFYSYPMKWKSESPQAPFLKVIVKWSSFTETPTETGYTRTKSTPAGEVNKEFYYKIPINPSTVSSDGYYSLNANEWYDFTFDVAILGSTADELPVILSGQYYVVDWNNPGISGGGSLDQNSFLNLATKSDTFYMYGQDTIGIPVLSSHNLDNTKTVITGRRWNAKLTAADKWETIDRGSVTVYGRSSFTFKNELHTTIDSQLDCYYMEFNVKIFNEAGLEKEVTIIQYPPIFLNSLHGGNAMVDGYYGNVNGQYRSYPNGNTGGSGTSESSTTATPYGPITRYVNENSTTNNVFLTIVSISSLGDNTTYTVPRDVSVNNSQPTPYNYLIADPRENNSFNSLINYYGSAGTTQWNNSDVNAIKIGNSSVPNYIAPKLLVASRWGRMGDWTNGHDYSTDYETAQKRCATYQEKGYPAGRWRLPTEAEVLFMISMQKHQFIRDLFTQGWSITASGSAIRVMNNNDRTIYYVSSVERLRNLGNNYGGSHIPSCRCVYDLWYWGDDPVDGVDGTYTIKVNY